MADSAVKRRLAASLIAALLAYPAVALTAGLGTADASSSVEPAACVLMDVSGTRDFVGAGGFPDAALDSCGYTRCLDPYTDADGNMFCHDRWTGVVNLQRADTAKEARRTVRHSIEKLGFQKLHVGRGAAAAIVTGQSGGGSAIAVGRVIVGYTLGATADPPDGKPTWNNKADVISGTKRITKYLLKHGYPTP